MEHVYIKVDVECENANEDECKPDLKLKEASSELINNSIESETSVNKTNDSIPNDVTNSNECYTPTFSELVPIPELEINSNVYANEEITRVSCSQCEKTFKNRANLKNHLKNVHSGDQNVECTQCFRSFKSQVHLRSHIDSVHALPDEVSCDTCHKVFLNLKKLKNHIYYSHPQPDEQVTCTVCSKTYKSQCNLKIHMKKVHPKGQPVPCPHCDKTFKVDMLLQRHIKWAHPDDGMIYKCLQCCKVLPSIDCWRQHVQNTHNPLTRATCELCNRVFKTKSSLDRHIKNVHNGKEVKPYIPSEFICKDCDRSFQSKTTLFLHAKKHENAETLEGVPCNVDNSNTHCNTCKKTYSDHASLQRHLASVHSLETATCHICMKKFKSVINLRSHMRITHAPPEAIQTCDICKKTFKCALHLRMHVNTVHTEGKFKCGECNKIFTSLKYLAKHKKTHSQTREHPCDICKKMFKSIFAANKHKRNIHSVECSYCHIKQTKLDEHLTMCPKRNAEVIDSTSIVTIEIEDEDTNDEMFKSKLPANKHKRNTHSVECSYCHIKQTKLDEHLTMCPKRNAEVKDSTSIVTIEIEDEDTNDEMFENILAANKHKRNVHSVECSYCHIKQTKLDEHLTMCPKRNAEVKDSMNIDTIEIEDEDTNDEMFENILAANKHKRNTHSVECSYCHIKQTKLDEHLTMCPKRNAEVKDSMNIVTIEIEEED